MNQDLKLVCADGATLPATLTRATPSGRSAVVIAPALGVPRRFYARFAGYLSERGYDTLCFDYRGIAGAGAELPPSQIELADWGRQDLQAALIAAREQFQPQRLYLVGHSIGGQIPGLAPASETLDGLVLVAASAPHPSRYALRERLRIELMWRLLVPLFARGTRFPARKLGFASVDLPSPVVRQWAAWGLRPDYLFDTRHGLDTRRYARLAVPMLSFSFADDGYASRAAVEALHRHYSAARITHRHLARVPGSSYGHFGYFRESQRDSLWQETAAWIQVHAGGV